MLMFREEKSPDDEIKAWQFWHSRQHSVKQRILDAGKENSNRRTNPIRTAITNVNAIITVSFSPCAVRPGTVNWPLNVIFYQLLNMYRGALSPAVHR